MSKLSCAFSELKMTWKRVSRKAGLHEKDKAPRLRFARQLLRDEKRVAALTMMSDEKIFALEESQRGGVVVLAARRGSHPHDLARGCQGACVGWGHVEGSLAPHFSERGDVQGAEQTRGRHRQTSREEGIAKGRANKFLCSILAHASRLHITRSLVSCSIV